MRPDSNAPPDLVPRARAPDAQGALHAPPALHRKLVLGGPLLVMAAFVVAFLRPGTSLVWILVGAAGTLVVIAARTRGADRGCAFCGIPGDQVPFLITGSSVSLCPACAAAASAKTAEELDRRGQGLEWTRLFLDGLPERARLPLSLPYVEAVAASDPSPEGLRGAAGTSLRFGHHLLAQRLLERIPEGERGAGDWNDLALALGGQGRHAEAIEALRRAAAAGDAADAPWVLAHATWHELQLRPDAPREDLARWLAEAVEARRLLAARAPPQSAAEPWHGSLASLHAIEAELLRRAGDGDAALRRLEEADGHAAPTGDRLLVRARTLLDLGRGAEARAAAEGALAVLRPDGRDAEEARRLVEAAAAAAAEPRAPARRTPITPG